MTACFEESFNVPDVNLDVICTLGGIFQNWEEVAGPVQGGHGLAHSADCFSRDSPGFCEDATKITELGRVCDGGAIQLYQPVAGVGLSAHCTSGHGGGVGIMEIYPLGCSDFDFFSHFEV